MSAVTASARTVLRGPALLGPLCAVVLVLALATDSFLRPGNLTNVLVSASIVAIPAMAMTLCIAMGEFDLSVGSTVALSGSVLSTWLLGGQPLVVALTAALVVGVGVGLVNGLAVTKLRVTPFIATLATLVIVRGLALAYTGSRDVIVSDAGLKFFSAGRPLGVPTPIWLAAMAALTAWWVANRTRFGRWVCAIGSNRDAAVVSGLPVDRIRTWVYVSVGALAAFWGVLLSSQLQKGSGRLGTGFELDVITVVVLGGTSLRGGRADVVGTLLGAVLVETIRNGLNLLNTPPAYQRISIGLLLVAALAVQELGRRGTRGRVARAA